MSDVRTIPGFPNYSVTKDGRAWSEPRHGIRGGWLKAYLGKAGYLVVNLYEDKKHCLKCIHRLVLETFVGPCPEGTEACHNNGNKQDNQLENLRWDTRSSNSKDAVQHGTHPGLYKGEQCGASKLTEEQVRLVFHSYHDGVYTQQELANHFGVSESHISRIVNKKKWGWLWETT